MEQPRRPHPPVFRVRGAYALPDVDLYARSTGQHPFPLPDVSPKFVSRARAQLEKDASSINFQDSVNVDVAMAEICDAVKSEFGLPAESTVFFAPVTGEFWHFPAEENA